MIRTRISLSEQDYDAAKREAGRLGISLAELLRRSVRAILPADDSKPWMRYAGMIETGDPMASQKIDDVVSLCLGSSRTPLSFRRLLSLSSDGFFLSSSVAIEVGGDCIAEAARCPQCENVRARGARRARRAHGARRARTHCDEARRTSHESQYDSGRATYGRVT
jgi:hypothetical protein